MEFKDMEKEKICLYDLIALNFFFLITGFTTIHYLLIIIAERGSFGLALAVMVFAISCAWFELRLGLIIIKK